MEKYYLETSLIEYSAESVLDTHTLYRDFNKAKEAMAIQIEEARENFADQDGEYVIDVDTCQEWRNDDGYGYTVGIEELSLQG